MSPYRARRCLSWTALAAAALLTSGCFVRHGYDETARARVVDARGAVRQLTLRPLPPQDTAARTLYGELLEADYRSVLILASDRLVRVPLDRIEEPSGEDLRSFLLQPRYRYGLDDPQLRALLEAHEQWRVDSLPPLDAPLIHSHPPSQADAAALEHFLESAEEAAAPLHSLQRAIDAGYRQLGPSFPGMGEHWIHPGRIVEGAVDPARPPVLCYASVDGERKLIGLAFAVPLEPHEDPPAYPAGRGAWHDHTSEVDEELLLLSHPGSHHGADGPRLAMFHAWLWLPNPDGVLAQNNWRLPFYQAGIDADGIDPSPDAARALSLLTSGTGYYLELFEAAARDRPLDLDRLEAILDEHGHRSRGWAEALRGESVEAEDLGRLEAIWADLWTELRAATPPRTFRALAGLR